MATEPISLRPAGRDDTEFLFKVYRLAHGAELGQHEQLLRMQFQARNNQYSSQYPGADNDVIMQGDKPIGYLCALRGPESFVLIDIALLPDCQGAGTGSQLVGELIAIAAVANKPLRANVLKNSPAWHLWQRLGFRQISDDGVFLGIEI